MYSAFMGLETAYRALITSQTALNVSGQNISNANTKGYSRQVDNIRPTVPLTVLNNGKAMSIGTGSTLSSINRVRDAYIDQQYRRESSNYEYWAGREASLSMVEGLLNETSAFSLSNDLSEFWNAWSELANNPEQSAGRTVVKEKALTLVETFNSINQQINDLQSDLDNSVKAAVQEINTIAKQIGELNIQIKGAEVRGDSPNDLKDQRDVLVDRLSELVPVTVVESRDAAFTDTDRLVGNYKLIIGDPADDNNVLVDNESVKPLQEDPIPTEDGFSQVVWAEDYIYDPVTDTFSFTEVNLGTENRGSLRSDLEMRGEYLESFRGQIDDLAAEIANAVNELHSRGQGLNAHAAGDGLDFFASKNSDPITAANITLSSDIDNVNDIATGVIGNDPVESGDATIALAIASLASGWDGMNNVSAVINPVNANFFDDYRSFEDYYQGLVAKLGSDVEQSTRMTEGQSVLVNQLSNSRENISGVSLDEEMVDLIKLQKGYSSAARLVTMLDSMLESVLGMGTTR